MKVSSFSSVIKSPRVYGAIRAVCLSEQRSEEVARSGIIYSRDTFFFN